MVRGPQERSIMIVIGDQEASFTVAGVAGFHYLCVKV